jgi:hypothetical protein
VKEIKEIYPYTVVVRQPSGSNYEIADWWLNGPINFDDMIVLNKEHVASAGQPGCMEDYITYGFKDEDIAILFRLKFG